MSDLPEFGKGALAQASALSRRLEKNLTWDKVKWLRDEWKGRLIIKGISDARDAALARAVVQAFDVTGGPVVVITGSGHADRARGIPVALAEAAPDLRVLSVGQVEGEPGPDAPFDLWIATPPHPRPDPCAAFR